MIELEIPVPGAIDFARIPNLVENVAEELRLRRSLRGTIGRYPGCIHWHFKGPQRTGVLEMTAYPGTRRLWMAVHANRSAPWIDATMVEMKQRLELVLSNSLPCDEDPPCPKAPAE